MPETDRPPPPPAPPPPPPGVSAGKRSKQPASAPPIHPLTIARCEFTTPDGEILGPVRLVIGDGHVRAVDRRSVLQWESTILGWSRVQGTVELRVSKRETVRVRVLR